MDPAVHLESRLRDLSRNASSAGMEVPLVHEADFRADEINLNAIPRDARFRLTLRVYGLDAGGDVTVEQFDANGNLLSAMVVTLAPPAGTVTVQLLPAGVVHPPQLTKLWPNAGAAVSPTDVPTEKLATHCDGQLMPPVELVTVLV